MLRRRSLLKKPSGINSNRFYTYHAFNGDFLDSTPTGCDLIQFDNGTGHPITFVNDRFGNPSKAVHFANTTAGGTNGSGIGCSIPVYSGDLTYSFWLKVTSVVPNFGTPVEFDLFSTYFNSHIGFGTDESRIVSGGANSLTGISSASLVGLWTHHVVRSSAAGVTDYFQDGIKILDAVALNAPQLLNYIVGFGQNQGGPLNGAVDDLIVLKELVSDEDVQLLKEYNT